MEQTVCVLPAKAVGITSCIIVTAEVAVGQTPFVTLHKNVFVPVLKALTCEEGLFVEVTFPVPVITDHIPVPMDGFVADKVAVVEQTVCVLPAKAVGITSCIIVTAEVAVGQTPFETVHKNVFVPVFNAVTCEDGLLFEVMLAVPVITDHIPFPIDGFVADKVAVAEQTVCVLPAKAVGITSCIIVTAEVAVGQTPFETVHKNIFVPVLKAFTCEEGLLFEFTLAVPVITDHIPVPMEGFVADKVAVVEQTVCVLPANEDGGMFLIIVIVEVEEAQGAFEIVHTNKFEPKLKPVTCEDELPALVILPVPVITDQSPVPLAGMFAFKVAELMQTV